MPLAETQSWLAALGSSDRRTSVRTRSTQEEPLT
jgi:hypothetical protein